MDKVKEKMNEKIIVKFIRVRSKMDIIKNNLEEYKMPGVWALWAKEKNGKDVCLEVGQTKDISDEVECACIVLSLEDDEKCKRCDKKYDARRRNKEYSAKFQVHMCKLCKHCSDLRTKSRKRNPRYIDKYLDMMRSYEKFEFVLVENSNEMSDINKRRKIEKEYAE